MVMEHVIFIISIIGSIIALLTIILVLCSIRIINEASFFIVERLGKYHKTWKKGIHFKLLGFDKIVVKDSFKEKVFDFPAQKVITKDNAIVEVDTVVYLKIFDPKLFAYGAENPIFAVENLASTTLRNLLGDLDLDQSLTSRETVNTKLTSIIDKASDSWGIKVSRVEIKNIMPPKEISLAMAKQMTAEREKRAEILKSEGEKYKQVLEAQGQTEALLLKANAEKQATILKAEGAKEALILETEAKKRSIELLNEANVSQPVLTLKALEQLGLLANGNATKIILPPDLGNVAKVMTTLTEVNQEIKRKEKKSK